MLIITSYTETKIICRQSNTWHPKQSQNIQKFVISLHRQASGRHMHIIDRYLFKVKIKVLRKYMKSLYWKNQYFSQSVITQCQKYILVNHSIRQDFKIPV